MSAPRTARERARAELTRAIKESARRQLAETGPGELSLRAVARDLGMVSSAVYRYFASRDELLTALIVDAYDAVGARAEDADAAAVAAGEPAGRRWLAVSHAVRDWAVEHRHEYALLYGTPVHGYAAPQETSAAAARMPLTLVAIYSAARAEGARPPAGRPGADPRLIGAQVRDLLPADDAGALRLILAWSGLIGVLGFELFGHFHGVVENYREYFDYAARTAAAELGILVA